MDLYNEIQNAVSEGAIPNEPETHQDDALDISSGTAPQDPTDTDAESVRSDGDGAVSAAEQEADSTPFLSIRFNHENKSLNRDEAINAAQIGLKYGGLCEKLNRAALLKGMSAEALIDSIISGEREAYKNSLPENLDGETVERLMKLYDIEQADKYKQSVQTAEATEISQEQALNERLATEFLELKGEFPEYFEYGSLPTEVRKAAEDGKDLLSALLLHRHKSEKAAAKAREQAEIVAKAGMGSLSGDSYGESNDVSEFKRGLWQGYVAP